MLKLKAPCKDLNGFFEFPWIESHALGKPTDELISYLAIRQPRLLDIARTLRAAGWEVTVTITGIAFELPSPDEDDEDVDCDNYEAKQLQRLGICEKCEYSTGRTLPEIDAALDEVLERVWYERADRDDPTHPAAVQPMKRLEAKYGRRSLKVSDSFELGMLNGKLSTLRWVLGDEWDNLDS